MANFKSELRKEIHDVIIAIRKQKGSASNFVYGRETIFTPGKQISAHWSSAGCYATIEDIRNCIIEDGEDPNKVFIRAVAEQDHDYDNYVGMLTYFCERKQNDREYFETLKETVKDDFPSVEFVLKKQELDRLQASRTVVGEDVYAKYIHPQVVKLYSELYD